MSVVSTEEVSSASAAQSLANGDSNSAQSAAPIVVVTAAPKRPLTAAAREVIREIVNTEEAYCKSLNTLRVLFIEPMQRKFSKEIWNADVDTLFRIIDVLIQVNGVLLSQLRLISLTDDNHLAAPTSQTLLQPPSQPQQQQQPSQTQSQPQPQPQGPSGTSSSQNARKAGPTGQPRSIGKIFLELAPYLKSYTQYVNSYEGVFRTLEELRAKSPALDKFITKAEESPDAENQKLLSFLIKPVQRIPRYNMLLNELRKHTPPDDPDFPTLSSALEKIRHVADHVNQRLREDSSNNRCIEIDKIMHGLPPGIEIVHPSRKFVHEGRLLQIRRRSVRELYIFLFNDMILFCTPHAQNTRTAEFDFKGVVNLSESCWVNPLPDNSMFSNIFQVVTQSKLLTFSAGSVEEKGRWTQDMEEQLANLRTNHANTSIVAERVSLRWDPSDRIGETLPQPFPAVKPAPINGVELLQLVIDAGKESMFVGMALFGFKGDPVRFELNFDPGQMLEVFETADDHWWIGRIIGSSQQQFGLVPAQFFHCQAAEHMEKPRRRRSVSGMIVKRLSLKLTDVDSDSVPPALMGSPDRELTHPQLSPESRADLAGSPSSFSQSRDSISSDVGNKSSSPNPSRRSLNIGNALKRLSLKVSNSHAKLSEDSPDRHDQKSDDGSTSQQHLVSEDRPLTRKKSGAAELFNKIGKKMPWKKSRRSESVTEGMTSPSGSSHSLHANSSPPHSSPPHPESEDSEFQRFERDFADKLRKTGIADSPTGQSSNPNFEWNRTVEQVRSGSNSETCSPSSTTLSPKARRKSIGIHRSSKNPNLE